MNVRSRDDFTEWTQTLSRHSRGNTALITERSLVLILNKLISWGRQQRNSEIRKRKTGPLIPDPICLYCFCCSGPQRDAMQNERSGSRWNRSHCLSFLCVCERDRLQREPERGPGAERALISRQQGETKTQSLKYLRTRTDKKTHLCLIQGLIRSGLFTLESRLLN